MFAEIIVIGDEILIGQVVDTNSTFIAKELNKIGVSVYQITSVQDEEQHILQALKDAQSRVEVVIITGGLGPTKDDITKHTLCKFFNDVLVQDDHVLEHVKTFFKKYAGDKPISDLNKNQALVPSKATVLHNEYGTAPGMWIGQNNIVFVSLPGVPFEMRSLIKETVIPKLQETFKRPFIIHKTINTYGMGESAIAEKIANWEDSLPSYIGLAYLPNLGQVRLRLTAKGEDEALLVAAINKEIEELYALIGDVIYGEEGEETIEAVVAQKLTEKGMTLGAAESFTGGAIAQRITIMPGASSYFKGSVVSYATKTKINVLGIKEKLVKEYSVVSEEVAMAMAKNVREILKTDFAVATTGNAGPTKGDADADVGTVFIAIATPKEVKVEKFNMGKHRERVVEKSVNKAFELLQKEIVKF